ncbi:copper amine oxidase N-terminal domain-containing protein [Desulfoscipio gibsoniae]|uniref:Copper amine oxidase family protein n=1 Tax=Desulfoscipio gibsoniae DSM 7213 TaxID=767817 RepID=R4KH69_9FIRM|nr:copper amine oxidase N-terminal domain-containing protein [Desulfoscipio gibsoniae]AGL02523.1 copper amine oxidase family protein [Desulfoscipio gibsoniae DSM 7213]
MFYMNKKFLLPLVATLILSINGPAFAVSPVRLLISGQEIKTDVPPQTVNGRIMVPVRVVSEYLGNTVNWDVNNNTVFIEPNKNTKIEVYLTKEEKAEKLKDILTSSARVIQSTLDDKDIGDAELAFGNCYADLHRDYTKFNTLFSKEFLDNKTMPAIKEIDQAYISALKSVDYPGDPYDFGDKFAWETRMKHNLKIALEKFNHYISIGGRYYQISGVPASDKHQDPSTAYIIYDFPGQIDGQWVWGEGNNPTAKDMARIKIRQTIFGLISPTRPANGSTIEEGYIQKVLIKELGSSREEVDYLIKFYQDYQKTNFN